MADNSDLALEEPWGQLVAVEGCGDVDRFPFSNNEVTIGRSKDCDISFPSSKFLSGVHCKVVRDEHGRVFVRDMSTNGTLVRNRKISKEALQIRDGDVLKLVSNKVSPINNIIFKFCDLRPEEERPAYEESLLDSSTETPVDSTLEYTLPATCGVGAPTRLSDQLRVKRPPDSEMESEKKKSKESSSPGEGEAVHKKSNSGPESVAQCPPDSMGDNLICGICQEIFHNCISLQPCMHSYCGGCYSDWMERSNKCPECRCKVERLNKNHIVNNLVEAYFLLHPEKKRPEEDLKELDAKNKITHDMLYPKRSRNGFSSDSSDADSDNESYSISAHVVFRPSIPAPPTLCRQCPGSLATPTSAVDGITTPPYVCPPYPNHVMCQCCYKPMPARVGDTSVPPQRCSVCSTPFCHMYWGCQPSPRNCAGCLNKYRDMQLDSNVLDTILLANTHESAILKDYLASKGKGINELLKECLDKVVSGVYSLTETFGRPLGSDTVICKHCAAKYLKELAYKYRRDLPSDELPAAVTTRPNCYYGRNCRTQVHNASHASRYNHICEQTRH